MTKAKRLVGDSYQGDPDHLDRLREIAEEMKKSKGALIRESIALFIMNYNKKKDRESTR